MKRPTTFKAPRPAQQRKPCETLGLPDCLQVGCRYWRTGKCSWKPAAERRLQAEAVAR